MSKKCFFIGTSWSHVAAPNYFRAMGRELIKRGHQVVFLIDGRRTKDEDHSANPAIYTWPSKRPVHLRDYIFARRLIRQYRPDCFIASFSAVNNMMLAGRMSGVPVRMAWYHTVSGTHALNHDSSALERWYLRNRKRTVYSLTTHLVAVSKAAAQDLQQVYSIPPDKCSVMSVLMDDPAIGNEEGERPRRPLQITCVGALTRTKGQDVLIRALPALVDRFPQLQVEFVGDGPDREAYEALAKELGVTSNCCYVGAVPHREVLERMASSWVVVVPSRAEALGAVNMESLAMGTPVVASDTGGIGEVIRDGVDGFLVAPEDPAALAARIERLFTDRNEWRMMSMAARQGFLDRFEMQRNIGRQVSWLEELTAI